MVLTAYEQFELLIPVLIAMVFGAIIGFEREMRSKPAGLRTHIYVTVSAALLVIVGPALVELYSFGFPQEIMRNEPISVLHAIILGISFIGAGTVFKNVRDNNVLNLTTAATLLFAGTVGVLVGAHLYYLAGAATLLLLCINLALEFLENRLARR